MTSAIDHEELNRRKASLMDAYNFSAYIPDDLRAQLEEKLDDEARSLVVQLQILAIQYGRALERKDSSNNVKLEVIHTGHHAKEPSNVIKNLLVSNGYVNRDLGSTNPVQSDSTPKIIVAPEGVFDTKHKQ